MKKIFPSSQYKKDYKRYRNQPKKLTALGEVIFFYTSILTLQLYKLISFPLNFLPIFSLRT